jgi:hypothetical protein
MVEQIIIQQGEKKEKFPKVGRRKRQLSVSPSSRIVPGERI